MSVLSKPADSVGRVTPIVNVWCVRPCGRVSVCPFVTAISFNFDSIATKILHIVEQTLPSPACARCDDLSNV